MGETLKSIVSVFMVTLIIASTFTLAFDIQPVKAEGTIYIRADGSIDPPTAPISTLDKVTYIQTGDIYGSIEIQRDNIVFDGAGQTIDGTGSMWWTGGIVLASRIGVTITNVEIKGFLIGIDLVESWGNYITGNNVRAGRPDMVSNYACGIRLYESSDNYVTSNNVTAVQLESSGIYLERSSFNEIVGNSLTANTLGGIFLTESSDNMISQNNIKNNGCGIFLEMRSSENTIFHNNISDNQYGIDFDRVTLCEHNLFYSNNIEYNTYQIMDWGSALNNLWDCGYPVGGNYWSDYIDVDLYSGLRQDEVGSDGIWDHPYMVYDYLPLDNYPLVDPWTPSLHKFEIGDWVRTMANLNVREGPGLGYTIISTMPLGTTGQILGGPVEADGFVWWNVDYTGGVSGWSAENWLGPIDEPPVPPVPTQPINLSPPDGATDMSRQPQLLSSPPLSGLETEQIPWEEIQNGLYVTRVDSQWQVTTVSGDYSDLVLDDTLTDGLVSRNEWQRPDAWSHCVFAALDYETTYYWRVRHKDFRGAWSPWSEETSFTTYQLNPPEADFNYSPENPKAGEIVDIDASDSHPGGGWEITSYRWDLDGDGDFDGLTTSPVIYYSWEKSGAYDVTLEVVNQCGDRATCSREITVEQIPQWERTIEAMKRRIFGSEGPTEEDKTRFEIVKRELRLEEFDEFYDSAAPTWVRDMQILMALNENIATEEGKINYGQYLLQVLHDMALVDSYVSYNWEGRPEVNLYFQEMAEVSSWVQWVLIVGPKCFPHGTGSILLLPKVFQAGVSLQLLYETLYDRAVWFYMNDPDPNAEPILFSPGIEQEQQDHLKKLREEYAFPLQTRREEFKEEVREKLRAFLHQALEKYKLLPVHAYYVKSPVELRVYDSQGSVTGLVDGEVREEIEGSVYVNGTVMIYPAIDFYHLVVAGIDEGNYGLELTSVTLGQVLNFTVTDIPASSNTVHRYAIDWDALSLGEEGVTVQVDSDGDGTFEHTFASDSELTQEEFMLQVATTIDFDPENLNLKSKGQWITCYIELPEGRDVAEIDPSTLLLNGAVSAETHPTCIGDHDGDGVPDLMVKFNRATVVQYLVSQGIEFANVTMTLAGQLNDGTTFAGSDVLKVSGLAGDVDCDGRVSLKDIVLATCAYGSRPGDRRWNDNANFAQPWDIINLADIVKIVCNYGRKYP